MFTLRVAVTAVLLVCAVVASQVSADPLTAGPSALPTAPGSPDTDGGQRRLGPAEQRVPGSTPGIVDSATAVTDVPSSSKTVDLLLEMQGKNPGLEGGERAKTEVPVGRRPVNPLAADKAGSSPFGGIDPSHPFGNADVMSSKATGATPQSVDWSESPGSRFGGGGAPALGGGSSSARDPYQPRPAGGASDEDDVRWLIPRSVVRFVRENRDMVVLGSVLVLVVLWAATSFASGRRK